MIMCLFIFYSPSLAAEGKVMKVEVGEVSQQHSSSKKEREREEQEINDSEEEGDLLEEEEEVRILLVPPPTHTHTRWRASLAAVQGYSFILKINICTFLPKRSYQTQVMS